MADKKIEDLPDLNSDDINPLTDYLVIQKPGGATYKTLASSIINQAQLNTAYSEVKSHSFTANYSGRSNYASGEFSVSNILSDSSRWNLYPQVSISSTGGFSGTPASFLVVKPAGSNLVFANSDTVRSATIGSNLKCKITSFSWRNYTGLPGKYAVRKSFDLWLQMTLTNTSKISYKFYGSTFVHQKWNNWSDKWRDETLSNGYFSVGISAMVVIDAPFLGD